MKMNRRNFLKLVGATTVAPAAVIGCDPVVALGNTRIVPGYFGPPGTIPHEKLMDCRKLMHENLRAVYSQDPFVTMQRLRKDPCKYQSGQVWWVSSKEPYHEVMLKTAAPGFFRVIDTSTHRFLTQESNKFPQMFNKAELDSFLGFHKMCVWSPDSGMKWLKVNTK